MPTQTLNHFRYFFSLSSYCRSLLSTSCCCYYCFITCFVIFVYLFVIVVACVILSSFTSVSFLRISGFFALPIQTKISLILNKFLIMVLFWCFLFTINLHRLHPHATHIRYHTLSSPLLLFFYLMIVQLPRFATAIHGFYFLSVNLFMFSEKMLSFFHAFVRFAIFGLYLFAQRRRAEKNC